MNNSELISCIEKAYELIGRNTPVAFDCGKLCNKKCCKGDSKDGMLLFPGEEVLFENNENFTVYFDKRYENYAVRCNGLCNRNERPLACRIFPYFIYGEKSTGKVSVAPDIRAIDFCSLIKEKLPLDRKFLRSLRVCAKKFESNTEIFEYLCRISEILTDFNCLDL